MAWTPNNLKRLKKIMLIESVDSYLKRGGEIIVKTYSKQPGGYYYPVYPMKIKGKVPVFIDIEDL